MPIRPLPDDPSFEHLRKQAKRLLKSIRAGEPNALAELREFHPRSSDAIANPSLADVQLVIARTYGFANWSKLKRHLMAIEPFVWNTPPPPRDPAALGDIFVRLACLVYGDWNRNNPEKARRFLNEHPEVAGASVYTAAAVGDVAIVRATIDGDPSLINVKGGPLHWEPLLYACYSRLDDTGADRSTLEVARLLLTRGADPNAGFLWGGTYAFTALTGAFGRGEDGVNELPHPHALELARLLLDFGADPNDGQTLYNRHFEENDDHLRLLFAYGLGRETHGPWPARMTHSEAMPSKMLVQELCWAAEHNYPNRVKLLLQHGVDVNAKSPRSGRTAYQEALRQGNRAIAESLLRHGATKLELDAVEAFALACIAGRRGEVRSLLAGDPALWDRLGSEGRLGLLHRAVEAKQPDGVRLIAELGVDVNGMIPHTALDRSALHNAAGGGDLELVKLLIDLGADPQLRDRTYHAAPIGWAAYAQRQHVVEYLMSFAAIFDAVRLGGIDRVKTLLDKDRALGRASDDRGNPLPFYLHPDMDHLEEMIRLLLAYGVDFNACNKEGKTVLDRALARGWTDLANVLRRNGAMTA